MWDRVLADLHGRSNSVSQVDGVSHMVPACWLCGFVEEGSEKGQWLLSAFPSGRKLSPSSLDARHFSSPLYATAAFQAAIPVLELRENESE